MSIEGPAALENKRVVVTGADGFIGSHLVEGLVAAGARVKALAFYNSFGHRGWLDDLPIAVRECVEIQTGDIRDSGAMLRLVRGCDLVFHLAALIAIPYSYIAPRSYHATNIEGTLNILEACLAADVERLVHTSTSEVFGSAQYAPIDECHPRQAQSPYAATKIAADALVQSYRLSFEARVVTLRPFNTFGPRQSERAVIPSILHQVVAGQGSIDVGSTAPTRDFMFVKDTVGAFLAVATHSGALGREFNAGTGRETSIGDLIDMVKAVTHGAFETRVAPERIRPKDSEVQRLVADSQALRELTGWRPAWTLEQGLGETFEWVRRNADRHRSRTYVV